MQAYLRRIDSLLRSGTRQDQSAAGLVEVRLAVLWVLLFGCLYGALMGTFGGVWGDRSLQVCYSAAKVPVLLLGTFCIAIPSFFVVNTLFGLRPDFDIVLRALVGTLATLTIILASLAPLTLLWYVSIDDYHTAILFNGGVFMVATLAGQVFLRRAYRPLIARDPRHLWMVIGWTVIYAFIGIQMAWVLRPFVGKPGVPVEFFREDAWGNAYVVILRLLSGILD